MSKKSFLRGSFQKWHDKWAETLLKSERQHLYHIYWSLWKQLGWKNFLLVICKILGLFVNPLTADDYYSLLNRDNFLQHFHMQLCEKGKINSQFFFWIFEIYIQFLIFSMTLEIFSMTIFYMTLIADVFLKLRTPKNVVR